MEDTAKYLIHADVTANGVVEREDVVGAVYGQTEGLLGDELDLRSLQEASKVGRIDVDVDSEGGRSFGELTIGSSMDRVETAVLAASLETIERVGPCRSEIRVTAIEDVRAAKRRTVVDRAKELLAEGFDEHAASSREILEEVRRAVRVEGITEYEGLPAGPNVADSDAIIVVEGRADVLTLLRFGVKNALAVEGTDVPDAVAGLTRERTVTAFLDGDRAGDLILKEIGQVGDVDYVALAPPERSVEDLDRDEVMAALRQKVPYDQLEEGGTDGVAVPTDGGTITAPPDGATDAGPAATGDDPGTPRVDPPDVDEHPRDVGAEATTPADATTDGAADGVTADGTEDVTASGTDEATDAPPVTLPGHVDAVVGAGSGTVRLLDDSFEVLADAPADEAFDAVEAVDPAPSAVVLDGTVSQRILDVAAQRGVGQLVARDVGDLVKQPAGVRVLTADQFR